MKVVSPQTDLWPCNVCYPRLTPACPKTSRRPILDQALQPEYSIRHSLHERSCMTCRGMPATECVQLRIKINQSRWKGRTLTPLRIILKPMLSSMPAVEAGACTALTCVDLLEHLGSTACGCQRSQLSMGSHFSCPSHWIAKFSLDTHSSCTGQCKTGETVLQLGKGLGCHTTAQDVFRVMHV